MLRQLVVVVVSTIVLRISKRAHGFAFSTRTLAPDNGGQDLIRLRTKLFSSATTTTASRTSSRASIVRHDGTKRQQRQRQTTADDKKDPVLLRFEIDLIHESEPILSYTNDQNVQDACHTFAHEPAVLYGLITPHPGRVCEFPLTDADRQALQTYRHMWKNKKDADPTIETDLNRSPSNVGGSSTGLKFTTGAVHFPGLTVESAVRCAVSQCHGDTTDDDPGIDWLTPPYEYHVLDTTNTATGRRPMVWIFEQIMKRHPPVSRSVTRVGLVRQGTGVVLRYHSRATVTCPLSRSLMRLLPASQARTEQWGSAALRKAVLAEVQACTATCVQYLVKPSSPL